MRNKIIGRNNQIKVLKNAVESDNAELIAVYGRRRVGKTFLVREFFNDKFDFYATGLYKGKQKDELEAFTDMLRTKFKDDLPPVSNWMDAFRLLRDYLKSLRRKKKIIVFLDELPWFDVPPGHFIRAFEWFWNSWGAAQRNLKMIVCGSSTTWMTDKFISGKGGIYNRTTVRMHLSPFNLGETRKLLLSRGIEWSEETILNAYMIFGGVPYYLSMLDRELSLDANVDNLYFSPEAPLKNEYDFLFRSLFRNSEYYNSIIDALCRKNRGLTRNEIVEYGKLSDNGALTRALKNLITSDFIRKYDPYGRKAKNALYQLTDLSILFYKRFVERNNSKDARFWTNLIESPRRRTWSGIAYEQVCLVHLPQIKEALGIEGVSTETGSWTFSGNETLEGCQIDLLIVRKDKVINICEMKYSGDDYTMTAKDAKEFRRKKEIFREATGTKDSIQLTLVTTYGLKKNKYADSVNQCIILKDLFSITRSL